MGIMDIFLSMGNAGFISSTVVYGLGFLMFIIIPVVQ